MIKKIVKYPSFLKNKVFSIPYNNDPVLIEKISNLLPIPRNFDIFIYFAPNPKVAMAGRKFPSLSKYIDNERKVFDSDKFDKELLAVLKSAKKYGIKTNLLLNNVLLGLPHFNDDLKKQIPIIQNYLEKIYKSNCLDRVTLGNPYLLELINWKKMPGVELKTSVNLQIKNEKSAQMIASVSNKWTNSNISCLELQKDLLREPHLISKIRSNLDKKIKLSILINEGCLQGCPYQMAHQVHAFSFPDDKYSTESGELNFGIAKCKNITNQEPWRLLDANWILPKQLEKISKVADEFKLTDRHASTDELIYIVKAYVFGIYDKENINRLVSMLSMEKFHFPEKMLPENFFNLAMSEKKPNDSYYKKIWNNIEKYNNKKGNSSRIRIKGKSREGLYRFIGND